MLLNARNYESFVFQLLLRNSELWKSDTLLSQNSNVVILTQDQTYSKSGRVSDQSWSEEY